MTMLECEPAGGESRHIVCGFEKVSVAVDRILYRKSRQFSDLPFAFSIPVFSSLEVSCASRLDSAMVVLKNWYMVLEMVTDQDFRLADVKIGHSNVASATTRVCWPISVNLGLRRRFLLFKSIDDNKSKGAGKHRWEASLGSQPVLAKTNGGETNY